MIHRVKQVIGEVGRKSEKTLARRLNGKQTPGSGNMAGSKGDVVLKDFLVEAKSTIHNSLGVKLDWLFKIMGEAQMVGKKPALAVTFTSDKGVAKIGGKWIMIVESTFNRMKSALEGQDGEW